MGYFKNLMRSIAGLNNVNVLMQKGQWVWPDDNKNVYIEQGYREVPNLYAIISLIIQKSSMVPFEVYRVKSKTAQAKYNAKMMNIVTPKDVAESIKLKNDAMDKVEGTELEMLLLKPNPRQSTQQFFEQLDGYERLTGNSYIWSWEPEVGKNAGKPIELHVPPSTMVSIITGDITNPVEAYKLDYLEAPIPVNQMGHFKAWNPITSYDEFWSGLYGMSPLLSCRKLMRKYQDADIAQGTMFRNMGPAGILTGEKDSQVTEEQALAIRDRFKQLYTGVKNAWEIVVTSANVRWQQIGLSPVDLNILEGKEEMLGELCNIYHVPIGMFSKVNSTENNMVEGRKAFITDAVIPLVESRKALLNRWLAPKFGDDLVIEFDYLCFSEIAEEVNKLAESAAKQYWITPNEKRTMTGWDKHPDPLMDKIYMPSGITPLDQLNEIPEVIDETMIEEEETPPTNGNDPETA